MLQGIKILYGPPTHTSYEGQPFFGLVILRSPLCGSFVWPAGHGYLGCALTAPSAASSHSREFILVGHRSGVALPMPLRLSVQFFTTASLAEAFFLRQLLRWRAGARRTWCARRKSTGRLWITWRRWLASMGWVSVSGYHSLGESQYLFTRLLI